MARKKTDGVNKSKEVRKYLEQDPDATAATIVPHFAARGIEIQPGFVNNVKSQMKKATQGSNGQAVASEPAPTTPNATGKKKSRKKKAARTNAAPAASPKSRSLTADNLVEAKKLVDELGGIDQARKALKYLEELG